MVNSLPYQAQGPQLILQNSDKKERKTERDRKILRYFKKSKPILKLVEILKMMRLTKSRLKEKE
jgi:predicted nucleotidyltransferase